MSEKGGIKTKEYSELFKTDKEWENHLIVAGGESLCVRWFTILSYIVPWVDYLYRFSSKVSKIPFGYYFKDICASFVKYVFKTKTCFVFSVGKNELPQFKTIAYNALGGSWLLSSNILDKPKVKKILNSVDFFTVRDKATSIALSQRNIKHSICPDTAILMSEVFTEKMLLNRISISKNVANLNYIFFQGNLRLWKDQYELAVTQLTYIASKTGYKICLCPIGTALGHSDQIALERISQLMNKDCFYINNPNIYDIMWLIKHSKMYIGSSLHGTITAMSFDVPYIGYGANKLKAYIDLWGKSEFFVDKSTISNCIERIFKKTESSNRQKNIVMTSFEELKHIYE